MGQRRQTRGEPREGLPPEKAGLHPRNRHRERYDFERLVAACPDLAPFVAKNPFGDLSIDFSDPAAVRNLNRALLAYFYGVAHWDIPADYLCPPVPGRADYLHYLADLLASCNQDRIPTGGAVHVLDIGVGANCVYPLLGHHEYGWHFTGSEIDSAALAAARRTLQSNPGLAEAVELRLQTSPGNIFRGLLRPGEVFDLSMCNPPFHASQAEAEEGTQRKWRNLGLAASGRGKSPVLNFGGQGSELWCPGGEVAFIRRMIEESTQIQAQCLWFTSLVSKAASLPSAREGMQRAGARDFRIIEMAQGQKKSRIIAWTFLAEAERATWFAPPHPRLLSGR